MLSNNQIHNTNQTQNNTNKKRRKQRKFLLNLAVKLFRFILRWWLFDDFFNDESK